MADLGKVNLPSGEPVCLLGSFLLITYTQLVTPFGTAACNSFAAVLGFHAFTEAMLVLALLITWLVRAFHLSGNFAFNFLSQKGYKYKQNIRKNRTIYSCLST